MFVIGPEGSAMASSGSGLIVSAMGQAEGEQSSKCDTCERERSWFRNRSQTYRVERRSVDELLCTVAQAEQEHIATLSKRDRTRLYERSRARRIVDTGAESGASIRCERCGNQVGGCEVRVSARKIAHDP